VTAGVSLAFFDPDAAVYGTARAGATLLFDGTSTSLLAEGPRIEAEGASVRAALADRLELQLEPLDPQLELGDVTARIARVAGRVDGKDVRCLGTLSETHRAPSWEQLDALRALSVLVDEGNSLLVLAERPRGALGHGEERVTAQLVQDGELRAVEDARISTVYDGEGRQRSAGLELWLPGEEFPRRGSGAALAGSSLDLGGVDVHAAVFRWRLDGRDAIGAYELMVRREEPAAA
jgi:hypothetical protein